MTLHLVPDPPPHKVAPLGRFKLISGWAALAVLIGVWWVGIYTILHWVVRAIAS